jgi:hypothetical protein
MPDPVVISRGRISVRKGAAFLLLTDGSRLV